MSSNDPIALSNHTSTIMAFSLVQLHGANLRLRLAQSQHSDEVHQLQEQMQWLVPQDHMTKLQQLLEEERQATQQLRDECILQKEKGRRLETQWVSGDKGPEAQLMVPGVARLDH